MDRLFATLEEWGIPGVKIDFMDRSDQWMVGYYERVMKCAARHRLFVDMHGSYTPKGLYRTYPNLLTYEGVLGMEQGARCKPENSNWLPFIRNAVGPMDFTPGTFDILYENTRNSPRRKLWNCGPEVDMRVNTTLAKQIAEWVIIYSPVQMASDLIENYEGHPAFRFFRDFDADCDWSRALAGEPGEFVAVVRRAGENYFLGAATDEQPRTLSLPLDFLKPGTKYRATIYADGPDADWKTNPTSYTISEREVSAADTLEVAMAPGGGQAVSFMPAM